MLVLNPVKCQGTLLPFLQELSYHKEQNRDLDEDRFFDKMGHRQSLIGRI